MQVYSSVVSVVRDREPTEEITPNTFCKAISAKAKFKGESKELTRGAPEGVSRRVLFMKKPAGRSCPAGFLMLFGIKFLPGEIKPGGFLFTDESAWRTACSLRRQRFR